MAIGPGFSEPQVRTKSFKMIGWVVVVLEPNGCDESARDASRSGGATAASIPEWFSGDQPFGSGGISATACSPCAAIAASSSGGGSEEIDHVLSTTLAKTDKISLASLEFVASK